MRMMRTTSHNGFGFTLSFDRPAPPPPPDVHELLRDAVREIIAWRTGANTFSRVFGAEEPVEGTYLCHVPKCQAAILAAMGEMA